MTHSVRLYFDAVVTSTASVLSFAASTVVDDPFSRWLIGGGFVSLAIAIFAYGQLTQKVRGNEKLLEAMDQKSDQRLKRIEDKVDTLVSDVAVALDRTRAA